MASRLRRACALAALLALPAVPAGPPGPYSLGQADLLWAPLALGAGIYGQIRYQAMDPVDTAALDRNRDLWAFDRPFAGVYAPAVALASDVAIAPLVAAPFALAAWEGWRGRESAEGAFAEAAVFAEALTLASGIDLWVRSLRVHPRPLVYDRGAPASERLGGEASGSFFSGHASAAFLAATFFAYTWSARHPGDPGNPWIWTGSLAAATGVSILRVAAGKHFPSDVLAGAAAGAGLGLLFPWMHRRPSAEAGPVGLSIGRDAYPVLVVRF